MNAPNQGSSLSQDSSLNRTPWEHFYNSGYKGPNEILQDVLEREQTIISVVKVSYPENETVIRGSLYKLAMMNSIEMSHLGNTLISPNW